MLLLRVRNGEDPVAADRAARATADAAVATAREERFEAVLDSLIDVYARPKNRRWEDARRIIAHDALPVWRDHPISAITRRDVAELMDQVQRRSPSSARALYAQLRRMFAWSVERMLIPQSPCTGMRGPAPVESRDRWLDDDEVRLLWRAGGGGPSGAGQNGRLQSREGERLRDRSLDGGLHCLGQGSPLSGRYGHW